MAVNKKPERAAKVPAKPARRCEGGDSASGVAFAPIGFGEAPRIGILGDSGTGKTTAEQFLIDAYLRASPGVVLVVDDKELRPRFRGQERRDVADLAQNPAAAEPRVIVFRGSVIEGIGVDHESVSALAWRLAGKGRPVLVVHDELGDAVNYGQWKAGKDSVISKAFAKGRAVKLATLWGAQSPQDVPREAFEQSSCILCFRLAGQGLAKLGERDYLQGDVEPVIRALPGDDVPPDQRGEFVLLRRARPWDGAIYRF